MVYLYSRQCPNASFMDAKTKKILDTFSPKKLILPILLGVGVLVFLVANDKSVDFPELLNNLGNANPYWLVLAFVVLLCRDAGYVYRIRHITNKFLSWKASLYVVLLWEFASAVTPSVVGGTAVAVFIINKEKVPFGKALAYVMLTAVLDNLFFVLAATAAVVFLPFTIFPELSGAAATYAFPLKSAFALSVSLIGLYTLLMVFGLFIKPEGFKWLLVKMTSNRLLLRWRRSASRVGEDVVLASQILKGKDAGYWAKALLSTVFVWAARYYMLNCLIAAFTGLDLTSHLLVFSRQVIMWVVMLVSPTPGSTGTAEYAFGLFFGEFFTVGGLVMAVALFWRIFTYYAYLLIGVITVPKWVRRVFLT